MGGGLAVVFERVEAPLQRHHARSAIELILLQLQYYTMQILKSFILQLLAFL